MLWRPITIRSSMIISYLLEWSTRMKWRWCWKMYWELLSTWSKSMLYTAWMMLDTIHLIYVMKYYQQKLAAARLKKRYRAMIQISYQHVLALKSLITIWKSSFIYTNTVIIAKVRKCAKIQPQLLITLYFRGYL